MRRCRSHMQQWCLAVLFLLSSLLLHQLPRQQTLTVDARVVRPPPLHQPDIPERPSGDITPGDIASKAEVPASELASSLNVTSTPLDPVTEHQNASALALTVLTQNATDEGALTQVINIKPGMVPKRPSLLRKVATRRNLAVAGTALAAYGGYKYYKHQKRVGPHLRAPLTLQDFPGVFDGQFLPDSVEGEWSGFFGSIAAALYDYKVTPQLLPTRAVEQAPFWTAERVKASFAQYDASAAIYLMDKNRKIDISATLKAVTSATGACTGVFRPRDVPEEYGRTLRPLDVIFHYPAPAMNQVYTKVFDSFTPLSEGFESIKTACLESGSPLVWLFASDHTYRPILSVDNPDRTERLDPTERRVEDMDPLGIDSVLDPALPPPPRF